MRNGNSVVASWQLPLIILISIVGVILAALILSQLDNIQRRSLLPPQQLTVLDPDSTIQAGEPGRIYLPQEELIETTVTTTANTIVPTNFTLTPEATAVSILIPTCDKIREDWISYNVKPGDSLSALAVKHGINKKSILQVNCLAFEKLIPGQIISLPSQALFATDQTYCGVPANWIHYVVHPSDTLLDLANTYNSTVYNLMRANCLESTHLTPGRKIFLPPFSSIPFSTSVREIPYPKNTPTDPLPVLSSSTPTPIPAAVASSTTGSIFNTSTPTAFPTQTFKPTLTITPASTSDTATLDLTSITPTLTPTSVASPTYTQAPPDSTATTVAQTPAPATPTLEGYP